MVWACALMLSHTTRITYSRNNTPLKQSLTEHEIWIVRKNSRAGAKRIWRNWAAMWACALVLSYVARVRQEIHTLGPKEFQPVYSVSVRAHVEKCCTDHMGEKNSRKKYTHTENNFIQSVCSESVCACWVVPSLCTNKYLHIYMYENTFMYD